MTNKGKTSAAALKDVPAKGDPSLEPGLDRGIQQRIGEHLRAMYDDLLQQPVPDRLRGLLEQLENKPAESGTGSDKKGRDA